MTTPTYSEVAYERRAAQHLEQLSADCASAAKRAWAGAEPYAVAEELKSLKQVGLLEDFIDSVLAPAFAKHYQEQGWSIELPCSLHEAIDALTKGKARLPDAYLQAVFPSFWHASNGPAAQAADPFFWAQVLRYPCGLNGTGEVYEEITLASMRRSCRVQRKTVSWFSAARALKIYEEHLDPKQEKVRIWDPSGGFGARMLAVAAWAKKYDTHVIYVACEPAKKTHSDLVRLGASLFHILPGHFTSSTVLQGSETFDCLDTFDLVFTSPPYFNTERYFDEPGQCWRDYPIWEQWKGSYLRPTVNTAKRLLRPGGKIVLNVKHEAASWAEVIGAGVEFYTWPVKAGPFARSRGQDNLNEHLLVWKKP